MSGCLLHDLTWGRNMKALILGIETAVNTTLGPHNSSNDKINNSSDNGNNDDKNLLNLIYLLTVDFLYFLEKSFVHASFDKVVIDYLIFTSLKALNYQYSAHCLLLSIKFLFD
jgi:hypothetical protein